MYGVDISLPPWGCSSTAFNPALRPAQRSKSTTMNIIGAPFRYRRRGEDRQPTLLKNPQPRACINLPELPPLSGYDRAGHLLFVYKLGTSHQERPTTSAAWVEHAAIHRVAGWNGASPQPVQGFRQRDGALPRTLLGTLSLSLNRTSR